MMPYFWPLAINPKLKTQNSKFNNFFLVCWFLYNIFSNFEYSTTRTAIIPRAKKRIFFRFYVIQRHHFRWVTDSEHVRLVKLVKIHKLCLFHHTLKAFMQKVTWSLKDFWCHSFDQKKILRISALASKRGQMKR